jgi:hypothetical protein
MGVSPDFFHSQATRHHLEYRQIHRWGRGRRQWWRRRLRLNLEGISKLRKRLLVAWAAPSASVAAASTSQSAASSA